MKSHTLARIAEAIGAEVAGDADLRIERAAEPGSAGPNDLALAMNESYGDALRAGAARAALVWPGADWRALGLKGAITVARPRLALAGVTRLLDPGSGIAPEIHASAVIDPSADIGTGAAIAPFAVIGADVVIGAGARIGAHCVIGAGTRIGADVLLHPHVTIGRAARIGDRFIAHPGAVIGDDGFSFVTEEKSRAEAARESLGDASGAKAQPWIRIHSLGGVEIGDDVEIGANTCVDAGTIRPTRIGSGTKIDNMVQIAHNCTIGRDCLFAGHVGLAGSVRVGDNVILGGKAGVADNTSLGDGVVGAGGAVILSNVPAGRVVMGHPATRMDIHIESYKALRRLPRLAAAVAELQKAVSKRDRSD